MESIKLSRERIEFFSDGVFAIAITLLVIEIEVPNGTMLQELGIWGALRHLIPSFLSFFISFMVIALYWRSHLQNSTFVKSFDNKLLWRNIWMLFYVVLLPFSTSFYAKNFHVTGAFVFYCSNLLMISLYNYLIINYIIKNEGYSEKLTPALAGWLKSRALITIIVWSVSIIISFITPLSRFIFLLIFVLQYFVDRHFKMKRKIQTGKSNSEGSSGLTSKNQSSLTN
jgi:uncharacterized membrane protein